MGTEWLFALFLVVAAVKEGEAVYCHRCQSATGGCGDWLFWPMHPWYNCPYSEFCVKVIREGYGHDPIYVRECEEVLMRDTRYRLSMPNNRRHGFCSYGRINHIFSPLEFEDHSVKYCFCNEYPGCNTAADIKFKYVPVLLFSSLVTFLMSQLV